MNNFKRSSIYIHFDNRDQKIVTPWLSLLKKRFWDVMDSSQDIHILPSHLLAEYDLVVLVISENAYTSDGEIKPEVLEFFNTATKTVGKNIILITLGKTKIPDRFSDDNLVVYQHKSKDSTINFLEYLRDQDATAKLKGDFRDLLAQVGHLQTQIRKVEDEIKEIPKANAEKIDDSWGKLYAALSEQIESLKKESERTRNAVLAGNNDIKASVSSPALRLDMNESFQSLSGVMTDMSQQVKDLKYKIWEFTEVSKKRAFDAAPNSLLYFMVVITAVYLVTAFFIYSAFSQLSFRIQSVLSPINVDTPIPSVTLTSPFTSTSMPISTPSSSPTQPPTFTSTITPTITAMTNLTLTQTRTLTRTPSPTFTPEVSVTVNFPTSTVTKAPTQPLFTPTVNATQALQDAFNEADAQFEKSFKGNIAFNKPEKMGKEETTSIELILSPSLSESELVTQIIERGDFVTSTADANVFVAPSGTSNRIESEQIEITNYIKAELKSQDPDALIVTDMLGAEQLVSLTKPITWRWSVTAKKEGKHTLELIITQLIKHGEKETWHEVETYKADIVVEVTRADRLKSLDWKWIAAFIVTLVGAIIGVWKWLDELKKKPGVMQVKIVEEKKDTKRKKK